MPTIRPFITCDEKVKTIERQGCSGGLSKKTRQAATHITNGSNGAHNDTAQIIRIHLQYILWHLHGV